jgi:hypothetical protein
MKKSVIMFSFYLAFALTLASCKQQPDLPTPSLNICRLDSIVHSFDGFSYSESFGYYPDGRLKRVSPSPSETSEYAYDGSQQVIETITTVRYPAPNQIIYELGSKGLATKSYYQFNDEESNTTSDTTFYTFNPEGYLIEKVLKRTIMDHDHQLVGKFQTITTLVVQNGNTTEERVVTTGSYGEFAEESVAVRYEYYENLAQKDDTSKPRWLGRINKNLPRKVTNYHSSGTVLSTVAYAYQLNAKGYPATGTVNGEKIVYHYSCP